MRSLFVFLPAIAILLVCLQLSSEQPPSTTTVNTQKKTLPPLILLPQTTEVAPKANAQKPPTSAKKQQSQKVIAQNHLSKAKSNSLNKKATTHPYTAPAVQIRVEVAQNVSSIAMAGTAGVAIASSTVANIIDGNGQSCEPLSPSQSF